MTRFTATRLAITAGLLVSAVAMGGTARAQQAASGPFGARVGNAYLPSTSDPNCVGIICNPLPASRSNPAVAAPPPACEGLICGLTPYSMQRPYTAAEAAAVERQRAAAEAQAAAAPPEPATPTRHARKHHKAAAMKAAARTPAPADPAQ